VIALIVRTVVAIPAIVVDVRGAVHVAGDGLRIVRFTACLKVYGA